MERKKGKVMEKTKSKIIVYMTISVATFFGSILLFITEFICKSLTVLAMSNLKFSTELPIISEPPLIIASVVCFIVSILACGKTLLLLREKKRSYDEVLS